MKKLLLIILLTFTTFANADEGKYLMIPGDELNHSVFQSGELNHSVWVLNTENGDIKRCFFGISKGVRCTSWRKNDEDKFYKD